MCLILFSYKDHPDFKLIIAANRDEFYERPTLHAHFWEGYPEILGGKDLTSGGTWMAVSKRGILSLVTNYRDLANLKDDAPSRGHLVADYLKLGIKPKQYLEKIAAIGHAYNGFNLLVGNQDDLWYFSNYQNKIYQLGSGLYGLSNALIDSKWPKIEKGKKAFSNLISKEVRPEAILDLLYDHEIAADSLLPDTGVGIEKERMLSSMFIKSPNYGTRCSTVITVDNENKMAFTERTYDLSTFKYKTINFNFSIGNLEA